MRSWCLAISLSLVACGGPRTPCAEHADCLEDQFCGAEDVCVDAFGRDYRVVIVGADVGEARPGGESWADESGPDLFVRFGFVESQDPCHTSIVSDSHDPVWNEFCVFELTPSDTFGMELWQETEDAREVLIAAWVWPTDDDLVSLARELDEAVLVEDLTGTVHLAYAVERVR